MGSAICQGPRADIEILDSFERGVFDLPGRGEDTIKQVWVFKAPANGDTPAVCGAACTAYTYAPLTTSCGWVPCPDPDEAAYTTPSWDPDDRKTAVGELDDLGVAVFFSHKWIVGSFLPKKPPKKDDESAKPVPQPQPQPPPQEEDLKIFGPK